MTKNWIGFNMIKLQPLCFFIYLLLCLSCTAQKNLTVAALHRYEIKQNDTLYRFYAIVPPAKLKYDVSRKYYGYVNDTIITTQGGTAERLLNGSYKVYFPNLNIQEEGQFNNGLKTGKWRQWYPNGQLRQVLHFKKGELSGLVEEFDSTGNLIRSGKYDKGLFTGFTSTYSIDGKSEKKLFKKGLPLAPASDTNSKN